MICAVRIKLADTDGDGTISVKESFAAIDTNNDGQISIDEFSRPGVVPPDGAWGKGSA